ncbi:MAG: wax ester/triacylglycerol synthase family O-acyltransferase [Marmoricola sp.]
MRIVKRMSGVDAAFWYGETPGWHMRIGAVAIHQLDDAPDFSFNSSVTWSCSASLQMPQLRLASGGGPFGTRPTLAGRRCHLDLTSTIRRIAVPVRAGAKSSMSSSEALISRSAAPDRSGALGE